MTDVAAPVAPAPVAPAPAPATVTMVDGNAVNPLTPGYTTTEFWATVVSSVLTEVVAVALAFGANISGDQKAAVLGIAQTLVTVAVAIYTVSRSHVKAAAA